MVKRQLDYWSRGTGRWLWWLLVTTPLSIPSAFIVIRDGVLPLRFRNIYLLQYLPSARVYWYWYVIFALTYTIVVMFFVAPRANRATLHKEKERHRKSFRLYRERTGGADVGPSKPTPEPNIVCELTETIDAHRGYGGIVFEGDEPPPVVRFEHNNNVRAVVARYRNKVRLDGKPIGGRGNVSAQVTYTPYDGSKRLEVNRTTWLSDDKFRVVFGINDPHALVVAAYDGRLYSVQEDTHPIAEKKVKDILLSGDLFSVCVNLVFEEDSKIISTRHFMLEVTRQGVFKVVLTETFEWKREKLASFGLEAHNMIKRQKQGEPEEDLEKEFQDWQIMVDNFLKQHLDAAYRDTFSPKPYVPPTTQPAWIRHLHAGMQPVAFGDRVRAKIDILQRFIDSLWTEEMRLARIKKLPS